jgi:hypothetical protein
MRICKGDLFPCPLNINVRFHPVTYLSLDCCDDDLLIVSIEQRVLSKLQFIGSINRISLDGRG